MTLVSRLFDQETLKKFSTHTIVAGFLMLIVGVLGMTAPSLMSIVVVSLLGWMFISSAVIQGYITYKSYKGSFSAWLKPVLSLITGMLFFIFPVEGVAVAAVMLAAYLMVDAFSSFGFAFEYKPNKGWWIHLINATISVVLAVLIMTGWPVSSLYWVGLYAAISLFFDGVALISMGAAAKKLSSEEK